MIKHLGRAIENIKIGDIVCIEFKEDTTVRKAEQEDYEEVIDLKDKE